MNLWHPNAMSLKVNKNNPPAKGAGPTTPNTLRVVLGADGSLSLPQTSGPGMFSNGAGVATGNTLRIVVADA